MKQSIRLLMLITTLIALLAACASPTQTPTGDGTPEAIYTAAAQTVMAQLTLEAGEASVEEPRRQLVSWNELDWYLSDNVRLEFAYGYGTLDRFGLEGTTQFFQSRIQLLF